LNRPLEPPLQGPPLLSGGGFFPPSPLTPRIHHFFGRTTFSFDFIPFSVAKKSPTPSQKPTPPSRSPPFNFLVNQLILLLPFSLSNCLTNPLFLPCRFCACMKLVWFLIDSLAFHAQSHPLLRPSLGPRVPPLPTWADRHTSTSFSFVAKRLGTVNPFNTFAPLPSTFPPKDTPFYTFLFL